MSNTEVHMEYEIIRKGISDLDKKVTDIMYLLVGGQLEKDKGLVADVKSQDMLIEQTIKRVEKLEKRWDRLTWVLVGMSITSGIGIYKIFEQIIKMTQ